MIAVLGVAHATSPNAADPSSSTAAPATVTTGAPPLSPVRALLAENRLEEASAICRQYDELAGGGDLDVSFACAWAYYRTNRVESGDKIMQRLRKQSATPEYQLLLAYSLLTKKKYDQAREITEIISKEQRGNPIGLTSEELAGEIYEAKGQLDPAAFIYKGVVRDDAKRARAHWGLGRYYLARGDTGRAKTHLEQVANAWPKHIGSRYNLAILCLAQDNVTDAGKWLDQAHKLDKADPGIHEQLGILFEKRGDINKAIYHWKRAVELKKDSTLAKQKLEQYNKLIHDALSGTGENQKALESLEGSGKSVVSNPDLLIRRARTYMKIGKFEKALADLIVYLNKKPKETSAMRDLGICYLNLRQVNKAHEIFLKTLEAEPTNGINFAWVAFVLEAKGELEKAREAWIKSLEFLKEPAEVERASRRLAIIEKRIGKREKEREKKERQRQKEREEQEE